MNIVYGGAFNPPTLAHEEIIDLLIKKFNPDNFIILPLGDIYKKPGLISFNDRYNMLKLIKKDIKISKIESNDEKYMGTLYSLDILSKEYNDIYFVLGADNFKNIKSWINYEELLRKYNFIILNRDSFNLEKFINDNLYNYKDKFVLIEYNNFISSTLIRNDLINNKKYLNNEIYDYIIKNNLYK